VLIASVGVSFAIIYEQTGDRLRTQIARDVAADSEQLGQSLRLLGAPTRGDLLAAARRYIAAQPFSSFSTLLFVLVPGAEPISNYRELFEPESPDDGESPAEQGAENVRTAGLVVPRLGTTTRRVSDVGTAELRERRIRVAGMTVTVGAGQPLASVVRAERGVIHSFVLAGAFIALAVLLGSYLVGTRVTAPLRRMARVAARVDGGDLEPRMEAGRADEVGVLATAFNHMLERLDDAFRGQREFIADASHELRTPLTVIQGQLEVLARRRAPDPEEIRRVERLVLTEIERMRRIVDDLLLLAQSERPGFLRPEPIDLERFVPQLVDDATLIADRRFDLGPVPGGRLRADPDRLAQALRNLITNAVDHTAPETGLIRVEVTREDEQGVRLAVLDDGPGIAGDEYERIFQRFHRTGPDRAVRFGGAGLGLAIVRAIAEAHGGSAVADNGGIDGGARFEIRLPGFTAGGPSGPTPQAVRLAAPAAQP
jgi:signal transduction histidine kinase